MQKMLAVVGVLLLVGTLFVICTTGDGHSASPKDEYTIPLGVDVNLSENMTVHLIQLTISNLTYGGAYSPEPENSVWPIVLFTYENNGMSQSRCRLHVQIVDNTSTVPAGYVYDKSDYTFPNPLPPGKKSATAAMIEFAIPKDRYVKKLVVIDDVSTRRTEIPIVHSTPTPVSTPTPAPVIAVDDNLRNLLLIPILLGIVGLIGWFMARNRLF